MPRANRHFIPGMIWHITHRCHKREFLLKFARDRQRWLHWLFEAKKRYGLCVLSYALTSNHVHLLVWDRKARVRKTIPASLDLVAGRTAQEYNSRKKRLGAFWQDRYHATAVETGEHLFRCMVYIDLNMVRAGVVGHPTEWEFCGYNELMRSRQRYNIIDWRSLTTLLGLKNREELRHTYGELVKEALRSKRLSREPIWTESVAVGSKEFVARAAEALRLRPKQRTVEAVEKLGSDRRIETWVIRENMCAYRRDFAAPKSPVSREKRNVC